jgi:uncharacterized membrane protein
MIEQLRLAPLSPRNQALFRALQDLVIRHVRHEREWLSQALRSDKPLDTARLDRYVEQARPLVERARTVLDNAPAARGAPDHRAPKDEGDGEKVLAWPCGA